MKFVPGSSRFAGIPGRELAASLARQASRSHNVSMPTTAKTKGKGRAKKRKPEVLSVTTRTYSDVYHDERGRKSDGFECVRESIFVDGRLTHVNVHRFHNVAKAQEFLAEQTGAKAA